MRSAVFILLLASAARAETPIAANLWDLAKQPERFVDKMLSLRAEVIFGFEIRALIDGSCPDRRIWFELADSQRDSEYNSLTHALRGTEFNPRKKVTATLVGSFETGQCFGHLCFSRSQVRVTAGLQRNVGGAPAGPGFLCLRL